MFTSEANAANLNLSEDAKINYGGDSSDDYAEKSTNQRGNDEEEIDPSRLENFL